MNVWKKIKKRITLSFVNTFCAGTHAWKLKRRLLNGCDGIEIGEDTKIVTPIHLPLHSHLKIGKRCWIGRDFVLEGNGKVVIGDSCDLAPTVVCVTGSHTIGDARRRAGEGYNGTIGIGNGVWIGTRAVLLPNVSIGDGVIVGAASVVTKDLVDNAMFAGNPAKKIRDLTD